MQRRKRVLVVDDEISNRELLEANLVGFGYDVELAVDGADALAKLNDTHDVVLLDVMMSGIDGFETARRIRASKCCADVPICMVTALSGKEQRLQAVECGANDFIAKPIDRLEVKIRTASLIKIKEAQDAIREYGEMMAAQNRVLEDSLGKLEQASALKDEFIQIASHDLKNPLTCIMGYASILKASMQPGTEVTAEAVQSLGRIVHQTKYMTKIIKDFLDFQSIEDGRITYHPEAIDLNGLARETVEHNTGHAELKGITLTADLDEQLPSVFADGSQIGQVLDNLVSNALKFGNSTTRVTVRTRRSGHSILLEVTDTGPGFDEESLPLLFVKYATLGNEPTGGESSTGLGLAICKRLIDLNRGEIGGGNNTDGPGANFWFKLPVAENKMPAAKTVA